MKNLNIKEVVVAMERSRRAYQRTPWSDNRQEMREVATLAAVDAAGSTLEGRLGFVLDRLSIVDSGEGLPIPDKERAGRVFRELRLSAMIRWIVRELGREAMSGEFQDLEPLPVPEPSPSWERRWLSAGDWHPGPEPSRPGEQPTLHYRCPYCKTMHHCAVPDMTSSEHDGVISECLGCSATIALQDGRLAAIRNRIKFAPAPKVEDKDRSPNIRKFSPRKPDGGNA